MPDIKLITNNLADELIEGIQRAQSIYILSSFVMESGVRILAPYLHEAAERGAEIKVLAGDYLFVTQPEALRALIHIDSTVEARLWHSKGTSFHPKAYLFDYGNGEGLFIVGSSNMSRSAYQMGIEWNLAMNAQVEPFTFQSALDKFMKQFNHENTEPINTITISLYEQEYEKYRQRFPELDTSILEEEQLYPTKAEVEKGPDEHTPIKPRIAQEIALESLQATREEGYDRAMVVMATGLGKTYLAGFFAQGFQRVLFVAHREEILRQAERSFRHIMPYKSTGLYNGETKNGDADFVFASIYTLGMKRHRERFDPTDFDLIVVDEFHHAASRSYQALLDYFQPQFLLGITATPDRLDGKEVYALCDGNVAYRIHFLEAIRQGWLSPFRYFGVHDETDYSQITWLGNRYDEEQLLSVQLKDEMAERIFGAWSKHKQTRTIAFCSSIVQAEFLAEYFRRQGIEVVSLHSRTKAMSRDEAITKLSSGQLQVIFTVDLFNEGVDIPSVDTLLFVRPTESLTVFTQQVGRGLRTHEGKEACHIIDLIGNYRNADVKLRLFQVDVEDGTKGKKKEPVVPIVPAGCVMDLEVGVINLLQELTRKRQPRKEKLHYAYLDLKKELGRRPTYLELHLHGAADSREYKQEFGSYLGFLHWAEELSELEASIFQAYEWWFREVEQTVMSKSYKMVLLLSMLERGAEAWYKPITPVEAAPFFHRYLTEKEYRKRIDFSDDKTKRMWTYDEAKVSSLIADMPMTKWSGSSKGRITFENGVFKILLDEMSIGKEQLFHRTKEIADYRLHAYFERKGN